MGDPLRAMLLIALLALVSPAYARHHYGLGDTSSSSSSYCIRKESCNADNFCAIKHNNSDMMTFRDGRFCGDLDGEYFKNSKWNENERECIICDNERRKGRKLLGGPIPLNTDPLNYNGQICCALKPDECCMQNPYASSGLPYDAANGLITTFNVMFWIYVVLMGFLLLPDVRQSLLGDDENPCIIFFWFTILFWTFPLWFPLYIVASFGYMIYKLEFSFLGFTPPRAPVARPDFTGSSAADPAAHAAGNPFI